jgi:hypothetical protein
MSGQVHVQKGVKTLAGVEAARSVQPPVPERKLDHPDLVAGMEHAARLGHSLGAIRVSHAAPSQAQVMPLIQRQEIPEEEDEELQMQREPAALQRQENPEEEEEELQMQREPAALQRQESPEEEDEELQMQREPAALQRQENPEEKDEELQMQREPAALQRQEIPEEEDEELQMQREPAALQRQENPEEEDEELQMKPDTPRVGLEGGKVPPAVESAINRARGAGQPLDEAVQAQMGTALGHDFSRVQVHTGAEAHALNKQLSARAFTTGRDIFFRQGEYNPGSGSGRELLAHELSHVAQQGSGRVSGDGVGITARPAGDDFEQEADAQAQGVRNHEKNNYTEYGDWRIQSKVIQRNNHLGLSQEQRQLIAENVSENMIIAKFGDKFRNLAIYSEQEEEKGGVHKGTRPDDAPIIDRFRKSYNQLEDWNIFIKEKHPEFLEQYTNMKLDEKEIIKIVKEATKDFKKKFREINRSDIESVTREYQKLINDMTDMIDRCINGLAKWYQRVSNETIGEEDIKKEVHEKGTGLWRESWRKKIIEVNEVLDPLWSSAKKELSTWQETKYLEGPIGDLDYIGSLAKGYKGPPKQYVRFKPEKFDVDANLEAPALAQYAINEKELKPDRGRIFGRKTGIEPLIKFAENANDDLLKKVEGIEKPEKEEDKFDVALITDNLEEQTVEEDALNALYKLREENRVLYEKVFKELSVNGYLNEGGTSLRSGLGVEALAKVNEIIAQIKRGASHAHLFPGTPLAKRRYRRHRPGRRGAQHDRLSI